MYHQNPTMMKALQQDRYYRLIRERRGCSAVDRPTRPLPGTR